MYAVIYPATWVLIKMTPSPIVAASYADAGFSVSLMQKWALA